MKTGGIIVLIIVLLLVAAGVGWVIFARLRAQRLGLPPPSLLSFIPFRSSSRSNYGVQPAPGGIGSWFQDRIRRIRGGLNKRMATGSYEGAGTSNRSTARHGFGPLDPDDAWDTRVGAEADAYYYNEEQELGLHTNQHANSSRLDIGGGASISNTAYLGGGAMGGSSYDMNVPSAATAGSGVGVGEVAEERGRTRGRNPVSSAPNPFDDDADPSNMSLRGVSPRPMIDPAGSGNYGHGGQPESPTERRSMFRENV